MLMIGRPFEAVQKIMIRLEMHFPIEIYRKLNLIAIHWLLWENLILKVYTFENFRFWLAMLKDREW